MPIRDSTKKAPAEPQIASEAQDSVVYGPVGSTLPTVRISPDGGKQAVPSIALRCGTRNHPMPVRLATGVSLPLEELQP
jgi:hypothetical protein